MSSMPVNCHAAAQREIEFGGRAAFKVLHRFYEPLPQLVGRSYQVLLASRSPRAFRAALMRLLKAESETIGPPGCHPVTPRIKAGTLGSLFNSAGRMSWALMMLACL
jgi:hypothetical protein